MSQNAVPVDAPQPAQGFGEIGETDKSGLHSTTFVSLAQGHTSEKNSWASPRAEALSLAHAIDTHDESTWTDATKSRDGSEANDEYKWTGATTPNEDIDALDAAKTEATATTANVGVDANNESKTDATPANVFGTPEKSTWTDNKEKTILGPYDYVTAKPGKEFRTRLLQAFNVWLKVSPESLDCVASVIRMLHNASLLVDDIQDNSTLRRGLPVAHAVYGVAQTINSANFVYFLALAELQKLKHFNKAIDIFTTEMLALHRGQGMDLFWRDTLSCPTEEDYLEMVSNKTGGLFRLAIKLMQAESDVDVDCMPFVDLLGLIFQITDDYKNLSSQDYTDLKGYCEDLTEGKFSFPVIHSIHAQPNNKELLNILSRKPTEFEIKRHAVECMERTGSFAYTRDFVSDLLGKARAAAIDLDVRCDSNNIDTFFPVIEKIAKI